MTRRAGALLLAGLLLGAGGVVAAGLRFRQAAPLLLAALERRLPGEVSAARARLGLWPPLQLTIEGLTATLPGAPAPYLETRRLVVSIDPLPLVLGRVTARAATLVEPRLALRLEDGWWEGAPAPRPHSGVPPAPREPAGRGEPGRGGVPLTLPAAVAVEGGRVELAGQGRSAVLDGIAGSLTAAPDGLRLVAALANSPVRLAGRLLPPAQAMEVEATVSDFRSRHLRLDGPLILTLRAAGRSTVEARVDFTRAELALPGLLAKARGEPGLLTASLEGDRGLAIRALTLRLGPFELAGDAHLAPERMALTLRTARLPLGRLSLEVAGQPVELRGEVTGTVGVEVRARAAADLHGQLAVRDGGLRLPGSPIPAITGLRGDLRLEGQRGPSSLRLEGAVRARKGRWGALAVERLVVLVSADERRWALPRIALSAAGGETVGSAALDPTSGEGGLRLAGARLPLAPLLRLTAAGWPGSGGGLVGGELSLRWRGLTWPEFRESARGHGVLTLEDGWLRVPVPERSGGRTVVVDEIRVPYRLAGTTLTIRDLTGRGRGWEVTGRGRVELGGPLEVRLHGRRRDEPVEGLLGGSLSRPRLVFLRGSF